jgi:hypothetical protein
MSGNLGKSLVIFGLVLVAVGAVMWAGGRTSLFRLPGDIVYKKDDFTFYFPLVTSVLLSLALTIILWLLRRR